MEELDYLSRFSKDLESVLLRNKRERQSRSSAYSRILSEIKSRCEEEILRVRDQNIELAAYVERFSNLILNSVSNLERVDAVNEIKSAAKAELLEQLIETVNRERDLISSQEEEQPPEIAIRKRPEKTRDAGERPESLKTIRNSNSDEKTEL